MTRWKPIAAATGCLSTACGFFLYGQIELWGRAGDIPFAFRWDPRIAAFVVLVPSIPAIFTLAAAVIAVLQLRHERRSAAWSEGVCWRCGYVVLEGLGSEGVPCPECGLLFERPRTPRFPLRRFAAVAAIAIGAGVFGTAAASLHIYLDELRFRTFVQAQPPANPGGHTYVSRSVPFGAYAMEAYRDRQGQLILFEHGD